MPTIIENKSSFETHPEGTFMATMRDCWLETRANPWKGSARDQNDPTKGLDERETITEVNLEFVTDHVASDGTNSTVTYVATASVAENSNLRKLLKGWFPALKDGDFERFDADRLIGRGAYITVSHRITKKGNPWAIVVNASAPPKAAQMPTISADFVRKQDRNVAPEQPTTTPEQPVMQSGAEDDDLPF